MKNSTGKLLGKLLGALGIGALITGIFMSHKSYDEESSEDEDTEISEDELHELLTTDDQEDDEEDSTDDDKVGVKEF